MHPLTRTATTLAAICLVTSTIALANPKTDTQHLSWQDGLSQTTVFSIHHDRQNSVWFATEDGLNRFDGERFNVYRHDPTNPTSLPANLVRSVDESPDGRIWLATEGGGVAVWNPATDGFITYRRNVREPDLGLGSNYTRAILADGLGQVWVATRDAGLDRLDPASGLVTHFRSNAGSPSSLANDRVYALLESRDGSLYVGTNSGLDRFDAGTEGFEHLLADSGAGKVRIRALFEDKDGVLWIGTDDKGLLAFDPLTSGLRHYSNDDSDDTTLGCNQVRSIIQDSFGRLWIGTTKGLNLLDEKSGTFERFGRVDISATGGSGSVTSLHVDAAGALWVGTELGGLLRWEGTKGFFKNAGPATSNIVTSFTETRKGELIYGTVGEGLVMIRKNGRLKRYKASDGEAGKLSDDRVMALYTDSKNRIWVGTMRGGLNLFNPKREVFRTFRNNPANRHSLSADGVMTVYEDKSGTVWVGTFGGGLNAFDNRTRRFTAFRHDPKDPATLGSDRVTTILSAGSGLLWVGTDGGGLNLFDPATGTAQRFQHDPLDPTTLPADTVCTLFADRFGTLWVGTRGGGLAKMVTAPSEFNAPVFLSYTEAHGLPNSVVYGIQPDSDGALWLSTNRGLSRFDPAAMTFMNFDVSDGLQANEFNFGASYRGANGELFFGGINGYNSFQPQPVNGPRRSRGVMGAVASSDGKRPAAKRARKRGSKQSDIAIAGL